LLWPGVVVMMRLFKPWKVRSKKKVRVGNEEIEVPEFKLKDPR